MKGKRKKHYYLVGEDRAKELKQLGRDLISAIKELQEVYEVTLHCSYEGNFIEILDPKADTPDGYPYVAALQIDEGDLEFEVSELIEENRR